MRSWLVIVLMLLTPECATAQLDRVADGLTLQRRADSLAHLDPERELEAALKRGDRRCIAIQGYLAAPAGVPLDSLATVWPVLCAAGMQIIAGTSDAITPDVRRLTTAAVDYGARYNHLLLAVLRREKSAPEPPSSKPGTRGASSRPAT